jgi:hypothetical protein
VFRTDLLERPLEELQPAAGRLRVGFRPFEIVTLKLVSN